MKLLEFFNEAQEVQLKNPGTLQSVLDLFLSYTNQSEELSPEVEAAEARCAVLRSRLDQSKEAGLDKFGKTPGQYGRMNLDAQDMQAVALALKMVGTPEDAQKLKSDLQGMRLEGLSANGSEGLGGHGEGFEVQNQGVTRRWPGEGPKANGGRSQPQQTDSYDQPQFEPTNRFKIKLKDEGQIKPPEGFETQDPHQGLQEAGPIAMHEVFGNKTIVIDPARVDVKKLTSLISPNSSLYWKIRQANVKRPSVVGINLNASEVEELKQALVPVSQDQRYDDVISQLYEAKIPGGQLEWDEQYGGNQFEAKTEYGSYLVHRIANSVVKQGAQKWAHVFYPNDDVQVNYEDGYAPTPGHAMQECERQYKRLQARQPRLPGVGAQALAPQTSAWGKRPLMNSRDRADEAAGDFRVWNPDKEPAPIDPGLDPYTSDRMKKGVSKMRGAVDRAARGVDPSGMGDVQRRMKKLTRTEGVYKLTEFYVISPEGNGQGNVKKDGEPEPIAAGGAEELSAVVVQNEPDVPDLHDAIAQAFDQAVKDGSEVVFDPDEMTIRLVKKEDKEED